MRNFKPGAAFDLFTVERSNLTSNGNLDPDFKGSFGLACISPTFMCGPTARRKRW